MDEVVATIRADQREQWLQGRRVLIESYLDSHPGLRDHDDATLDLIYSEVLLRKGLGEAVSDAEYRERFPRYADQLRRLFEIDDAIEEDAAADWPDTENLPGPNGASATVTAPAKAAPEFPAIPGYEFLERLPAGGPGVVYKAHKTDLKLDVALKMIRHDEDATDPQRQALFRREAEAVARLNHPHVVRIYDFGVYQGRPYFTMEFVAVGSLQQRLRDGPLPPREAAAMLETLARAMHEVHQKGIIHRDLKPGNVLLGEGNQPKIADFGLAKFLNAEKSLTPSEAIVGTVHYMAPEQAVGKGRDVKEPADVYGLGAILYHALTGRPPFEGVTFLDILRQIISQEPKSLGLGPAQRDLESICLRCLEKEPRRRYASAEALADDLHRYLEGKQTKARPRRWYEKVGRGVRKRPWVVAVSLLFAALWFLLPVLFPPPDPDRERRRAERLLAEGKPYVFAGHELLPGPFRWVGSAVGKHDENAKERCFSVESLGKSLFELVTDPQCESYRFSTEVRHDYAAEDVAEVGVFFALRCHPTPENTWHYGYYTIAFADRNPKPHLKNDKGESIANAQAWARLREGDYDPGSSIGSGREFRPLKPYAPHGIWRQIELRLTPQGATWYWRADDGLLARVDHLSQEDLALKLNWLKRRYKKIASVDSEFHPRLSLGLYVARGKASFRNIEVSPLVGD
jgi:serine/threonine-protein kinase